jgi:hypothetical protein
MMKNNILYIFINILVVGQTKAINCYNNCSHLVSTLDSLFLDNIHYPDDTLPGVRCSIYPEFDTLFSDSVFRFVEIMPTFGKVAEFSDRNFATYIFKNLRLPPRDFAQYNEPIQGTVEYAFVLDTLGSPTAIRILKKNIENYTLIDRAFIQVISQMPCWQPGICGGKKVPVLRKGVIFITDRR